MRPLLASRTERLEPALYAAQLVGLAFFGIGLGALLMITALAPDLRLGSALIAVASLSAGLLLLLRVQYSRNHRLQAQLAQQRLHAQQAEHDLARANSTLQMLSAVNRIIASALDEPGMLQQTCETIIATGDYQLAWIGMVAYDADAGTTQVACAGDHREIITRLHFSRSDPRQDQAAADGPYCLHQPIVIADLSYDQSHDLWLSTPTNADLHGLVAIPLREQAQTIGVLCLYSIAPDVYESAELALFSQLGTMLTFGLQARRAQAVHQIIEHMLRTEQIFAQLVTATSPIGIMVVDQRGRITFANPHAEYLLAMDQKTLFWRGLTAVEHTSIATHRQSTLLTVVKQGQRIHKQHHSIIAADGTHRTLEVSGAPLPNAQGQPYAMVLTLNDISTQVFLEAALVTAQHELEQRVAARTQELATLNERLACELNERQQIVAQLAERERFVSQLADALPSMLLFYDLKAARYLYANRAISAILGYSIADFARLSGAYLALLVHPDDQQQHRQHLVQLRNIRNNEPLSLECRVRHQDGSWRWLSLRTVVFQRDADGTPIQLLGTARDATTQRRAEQALYDSHQQLQSSLVKMERQTNELSLLSELVELLQLCASHEEIVAVLRRSLPLLFAETSGAVALYAVADASFSQALHWGPSPPPNDCDPSNCWALRYRQLYASDSHPMAPRCRHANPGADQAIICMPIQAHDEIYGILTLHVSSPRSNDQPHLWLRTEQERLAITLASQIALSLANLQLRASLQIMATHDPLTGLLNRRALDDALLRELRRARRSEQPCGIIMLDIDHFKQINDSDGHAVGDLILQLLARLLTEHIRTTDLACRYGGEEFVILLPGANLDESARRAEQLRNAVEQLALAQTGTSMHRMTISLGVSAFPNDGESGPALLAIADAALYAAKRAGRNRVIVSQRQPALINDH
jgi:diguanylate cyclase (GGDEF)-like protein/PAS domain S-box-containing protein